MANEKRFLDHEGTERLVEFFNRLLNDKVDKDNNKSLSTEDFTTELKRKLESLDPFFETINFNDGIVLYGGSASDVMNTEESG